MVCSQGVTTLERPEALARTTGECLDPGSLSPGTVRIKGGVLWYESDSSAVWSSGSVRRAEVGKVGG